MDALTHVFLPLTVLYALRPALFDRPVYFGLGAFGLVPDLDKLLGAAGLFHSLTTMVPLSLGLLALEWAYGGDIKYTPVAVALVGSHLCLDIVDGGPVPLLFPIVDIGIGLTYPVQVTFSGRPPWISFSGAVIALRNTVPQSGYHTYGFINQFGVASTLAFLALYVGEWSTR